MRPALLLPLFHGPHTTNANRQSLFCHSFAYSLIHSLIHSLSGSFIRLFVCSWPKSKRSAKQQQKPSKTLPMITTNGETTLPITGATNRQTLPHTSKHTHTERLTHTDRHTDTATHPHNCSAFWRFSCSGCLRMRGECWLDEYLQVCPTQKGTSTNSKRGQPRGWGEVKTAVYLSRKQC